MIHPMRMMIDKEGRIQMMNVEKLSFEQRGILSSLVSDKNIKEVEIIEDDEGRPSGIGYTTLDPDGLSDDSIYEIKNMGFRIETNGTPGYENEGIVHFD